MLPSKDQFWLGLTAMLLGVTLTCLACNRTRETPHHGRALLIGIDGATFRIAGPLMEAGKLPNLAQIARKGVSGPLRSLKPLHSPRIWNTISTGKLPEKHGIIGFAHKDDQGVQRLYLSNDRKVHSLWNIVSDAGLSVGVVNWWNTFPLEPIHGVMVSDHLIAKEIEGRRQITGAVADPEGAVVYPEDWQARLLALAKEDLNPIRFDDPFYKNTHLPKWQKAETLSRWFRQDSFIARFALEIEAVEHPDVMMVLLTGIDRVSHSLWGVVEPAELYPEQLRPTESERAAGLAALQRYYEYTDVIIGKLLENYAPEDLVMIVSDHGFEAGISFGSLTGTHESDLAIDGVFFARGADIPKGKPAGPISVLDITPTILAWLDLPVAWDMDGRVARFLEKDTNQFISTYETKPVERLSSEASGADETLIEQLRALGYIE